MARRGFTLIEMVVVIFFVSLALVGVMSGIRNIAVADSKAYNADLLQKLALEKIKEIGSITDPNTVDAQGNFAEQGYPEVTWQVSVASSGLANLDTITLTATQGNASQALTSLVYTPSTTTGTTGTGGTTP